MDGDPYRWIMMLRQGLPYTDVTWKRVCFAVENYYVIRVNNKTTCTSSLFVEFTYRFLKFEFSLSLLLLWLFSFRSIYFLFISFSLFLATATRHKINNFSLTTTMIDRVSTLTDWNTMQNKQHEDGKKFVEFFVACNLLWFIYSSIDVLNALSVFC